MRLAYLDCFAGISGDMFLGALIDAGVPLKVLHDAVAALDLGATLKIETVDRSGISCTKVHVLEGGRLADGGLAETGAQPKMQHLHEAGHAHDHEHGHQHSHAHSHDDGPQTHEETHGHVHGRSLTAIRELIRGAAALDEQVKRTAIDAFELLGRAEANIHNVPVEAIHFHEVGAVDAIVDIVASSAGIHHLNVDAWHCSPVNVGGGMVECAHGTFPVPAPATADLLRGVPTYSAHVQKELVTPTGAALLRALAPVFGQQPPMQVERVGYGAGTRNPKGFPNVLRMSIGESSEAAEAAAGAMPGNSADHVARPASAGEAHGHAHHAAESQTGFQTVTVLETALDDLSPQVLAYFAETALAQGALDVMLTPVVMKKGRPGTLLTILCNPSESEALQRLMLRETSTLGIRIRQDRRTCLERSHTTVQTAYGEIRMKVGSLGDEAMNAAPEFEDCRAAALRHTVPLKQVQQAAIAAYWR